MTNVILCGGKKIWLCPISQTLMPKQFAIFCGGAYLSKDDSYTSKIIINEFK